MFRSIQSTTEKMMFGRLYATSIFESVLVLVLVVEVVVDWRCTGTGTRT